MRGGNGGTHGAVADQQGGQAGRGVTKAGEGALENRLHRQRGERGFFRRLPQHRIAADQRQRRIPGPDRDREVEGGDDADHAERVPGFHHAVRRTLGRDGQAVELAGQADGEVANVDHLLHLALAFRGDLADLDGDQLAEIGLGGAQLLPQQAHQLATPWGWDAAPGAEGGIGGGDGGIDVGGGDLRHCGDQRAGDGGTNLQCSAGIGGWGYA